MCFYSSPPPQKKKQKPSQLGNTEQINGTQSQWPSTQTHDLHDHPSTQQYTPIGKKKRKKGNPANFNHQARSEFHLRIIPSASSNGEPNCPTMEKKSMALSHNRYCCLSTIKWNMKTPKRCFGFCCLYTATWVSIFKFCFVKTPGETRFFFLLGPITFCFFKTGNLFLNLATKHPLKLLSSNISKSKLVFYRVLLGLLVC